MAGYVDLHDHVLPGVDDGADTLEESVAILRTLFDLGYRRIACTPHVRDAYWCNTREGLTPLLDQLREAADTAGLEDMEIALGAENYLQPGFFTRLDEGSVIPLGDGGHVLVELTVEGVPTALEEMLFQIEVRGLVPVLAHPERYRGLMEDLDRLQGLQERGCLLQVSITSLAGKFGWSTQRAAKKLIRRGLCDFVATDIHSLQGCQRFLPPALEKLHKLVGHAKAEELLSHVPNTVLGPQQQSSNAPA